MQFPKATVEHLVEKHSDHNPLLLRCCHSTARREGRPFQFQAAWCTHADYNSVVSKAWNKGIGRVPLALKNVMQDSMRFNKKVFGNIFEKKRKLEARLRCIHRSLETVDSAVLVILQKDLLVEYEEILFQEEAFWFQKSREQWIRLGSRNTAFFHTHAIIRRKGNKIHGLHLPSGEWCTNDDRLSLGAVNFMKALFGEKESLTTPTFEHNLCRLNRGECLDLLIKPVTNDEVHAALMSMESFKAPGPDGFQPIFFKMF